MRKPLLIAGGVVGVIAIAIVAVIAIQLFRSDDPDLATEAPVIPTETAGATSGVDAPSDATGAEGSAAGASDGVRRFVIVPEDSEAKYVVRESLRGITTNAVGTTSAIEGEVYLTEAGLGDATPSSFRVDLDTLTSDEGRRDSFIKENTLQTDQFQFAEFVIDEVIGFPTGYTEGEEIEITLDGTLTIRDVEQPVTWTVLARQSGDTLTAVADTLITFQDFGMDPPSVTIATAEDEIQIQVVLTAREAAA